MAGYCAQLRQLRCHQGVCFTDKIVQVSGFFLVVGIVHIPALGQVQVNARYLACGVTFDVGIGRQQIFD